MDAGDGTGSIPFPSLQEAKKIKIKIWGPYTETLPTLRREKRTVNPALPQKKKREKHKKYEQIGTWTWHVRRSMVWPYCTS